MTLIRDITTERTTFDGTEQVEVDIGVGDSNRGTTANLKEYVYPAADAAKLAGVEAGAEVNPTAAETKTAYESNADTNAFTDAEQTKLAGIAAGAEVNTVDSVNAETGAVVLDAADVGAVPDATFQAKGDLVGGTGVGAYDRLPVGTDGERLIADSAELTGVKWAPVTEQPGATANDLLVGTGVGTAGWAAGGVATKSLYEGETKINGAAVTYEVQDVDNVTGTHAIVATTPVHVLTMTGNTTFSFLTPGAGVTTSFVVQVFGAFTPTWPTIAGWMGGEPTYATGTTYTFWTHDGGTTYYAQGAAPA